MKYFFFFLFRSVEYEKVKFQEFLLTVEDGLVATREWLVSSTHHFSFFRNIFLLFYNLYQIPTK